MRGNPLLRLTRDADKGLFYVGAALCAVVLVGLAWARNLRVL